MTHLFHANTIAQYKIMKWLMEQGITREDVCKVDLPEEDTVIITNPAGQYLVVKNNGGEIHIVTED
ncbi:MAG: hypothetical protein QM689_12600 [Oscillospiraceae bacterium]